VKKKNTADRQNIAGEGITKKDPGAGIQVARSRLAYEDERCCTRGPFGGVIPNQVSSVRESVEKRVSWQGAAIQSGLERGS
jgi:hypothetical protein